MLHRDLMEITHPASLTHSSGVFENTTFVSELLFKAYHGNFHPTHYIKIVRNNTRGCLTKTSQTCRQQITFGDFCSNVHTSTAHLSPFPPTHHMRPCTGLQGCRGTTPCSGKTGIAGECFEGRTPSSTTAWHHRLSHATTAE